MSELYNVTASTLITDAVNINTDQDIVRVTQRTLDGQYYTQIIGDPAPVANITAWVNKAGKTFLMQAEAAGDMLRVVGSDGETIKGTIIDRGSWDAIGCGYYSVTIKLGVSL